MKIKLIELINTIQPLAIKGSICDIVVEHFSDDSRDVNINTLFFAIKGVINDGHNFLSQISNHIAAAVVEHFVNDADCVQILVPSSKAAFLSILQMKYGVILGDFNFIGITGTNGKTTFTFLMESILKASGKKPAVIGTVNYRFLDNVYEAPNTTPALKQLIPMFKQFFLGGCTDVVMEVSSHALTQKRLEGIKFEAACFSNLTSEHLDYHKDLEDYYNAKKLLFTEYLKQDSVVVINVDDSYGERLFGELGIKGKHGFSFKGKGDFKCSIIKQTDVVMQVEIDNPDLGEKDVIITELQGQFNAYNVATAYITALLMGYNNDKIKEGIFALKTVPGRLEEIRNDLGVKVFVDYAHTPDALLNILKTTRGLTKGRLIIVFGCGGDRDKTKRPVMGKIACQYADIVVVTSDNPRNEDPKEIINEIVKGIDETKKVIIQPDREKAIFEAFFSAKKGDTLVIAGKGHEDYQIIGNKKIHFSDQEVARKALEKRRCLAKG